MAAPAAPTSVFATAGYAMARVFWKPDPVTIASSYTVTASPGGATVTVTTPAGGVSPPLQAIFPVLTNGTAYTFTVTASNGDGTSPSSAPSNSVTPTLLPGQLPNVVTVLMAQLASDYAKFNLGNPPEMQFGEQYLSRQSDAPRIVFVPKDAPGNTWKGRGSTHLGNGITTPKQIGDREQVLEAWIWGTQLPTSDLQQDELARFGVAEQIGTRLAASMKRAFNGTELPAFSTFPKANGANLARGCLLMVRFVIRLPFVDYLAPSVSITSVTASQSLSPPS